MSSSLSSFLPHPPTALSLSLKIYLPQRGRQRKREGTRERESSVGLSPPLLSSSGQWISICRPESQFCPPQEGGRRNGIIKSFIFFLDPPHCLLCPVLLPLGQFRHRCSCTDDSRAWKLHAW